MCPPQQMSAPKGKYLRASTLWKKSLPPTPGDRQQGHEEEKEERKREKGSMIETEG